MSLNKQYIMKNYFTSVLPPEGLEDMNQFYQDTCVQFDAFWRMPDGNEVGLVYKNLTKALKAYEKYGFTEADILKMHPKHEEIKANTIRVKNAPDDHIFTGFRLKVPYNKQTKTVMK